MKVLQFLQYLLIAGIWWLYRLLPPQWAYGLGWGIGAGLFSLFKHTKRMRTAVDNVIVAGLAKTRQEAYRIARYSLGHFLGQECESLRISGIVTQKNWRNYVELEMSPAVEKILFEPNGPLLIATGHLGAWESAITAITSARPMYAVARPLDNPFLQRFLERHNFRGGATILPKKHGFSAAAMRRLRETKGVLAILFDQFASDGAWVEFFGHRVPFHTSPARVHLRSKVPLVVGGFIRTGRLRYKMIFVGDPILVPKEPDISSAAAGSLTATLAARLEQVIRRAPEQYLWLHRRFRGIPVPEVPEK